MDVVSPLLALCVPLCETLCVVIKSDWKTAVYRSNDVCLYESKIPRLYKIRTTFNYSTTDSLEHFSSIYAHPKFIVIESDFISALHLMWIRINLYNTSSCKWFHLYFIQVQLLNANWTRILLVHVGYGK